MVQHETWDWILDGFKYDLEAQVKPRTVEYYLSPIRLFASWVQNSGQAGNPRTVTKRHLQEFLHYITQDGTIKVGNGARHVVKRSERTKWPYYRAFKRFFPWAVREGYIEHNPLDGIVLRPPKAPPVEPYRPEHIDEMRGVLAYDWRMAKTLRQRMLAARDEAVLLLFLESGLRLQELANLKVGDVDIAGQRLIVREGKMGKGRSAGFGPQTRKALWKYVGLRGIELQHDSLWVTEEFNPISKRGISEIVRRLKRDAGLGHLKGSVHRCRHTFATAMLRHTKDMKGCRLLLGHSTLAMTERYTQAIDAEDALQAYDGKGPLDWMKG